MGHGIGLRTAHFSEILKNGPGDADFFEIISENFFEPGGRPWAVLERLRSERPVVMHGVSMGVGNADGICLDYLSTLKEVISRVQPEWVSDHICWGAYGGHHAHDLLPLPYTEEVIAHVARQVMKAQDFLGRQILLENVSSYVTFDGSAMAEWDFVAAIAERADCGILLDVNNIYVSSQNHGYSPLAYLAHIPGERVGQIHLAGHTDYGAYILDSHVGPVPTQVWDLYREAVQRFGPVPTLVEWDDQIPDYDVVLAETKRAAAIEAEVLTQGVAP